jgi:hypothetical protein
VRDGWFLIRVVCIGEERRISKQKLTGGRYSFSGAALYILGQCEEGRRRPEKIYPDHLRGGESVVEGWYI